LTLTLPITYILITAVIFNGKNYDLWEKAVATALRAKSNLGFIDGSLTKCAVKKDGTSELQAWEMANSMISSWILNIIDLKLRTSVAYTDTAKAMWDTFTR